MEHEIPFVVQELYTYFVSEPNPKFWPEQFKDNPVQGHGLWSFYQALRLATQFTDACLEKL